MKVNDHIVQLIKDELQKLNEADLVVEGRSMKACNCYYFSADPLHVLYNTNCPDSLKHQIERIITTYLPDVENSTFKQAQG